MWPVGVRFWDQLCPEIGEHMVPGGGLRSVRVRKLGQRNTSRSTGEVCCWNQNPYIIVRAGGFCRSGIQISSDVREGCVVRAACSRVHFFRSRGGLLVFCLYCFLFFSGKRSGGPDGPGLLAAACRAWYFLNPELVGRTRGSLSSEPRPPRSYVVPA